MLRLGYLEGTIEVRQSRICTVCWGSHSWWLKVVNDPDAALAGPDPDVAQEIRSKIDAAHGRGVIVIMLRRDPELSADIEALDARERAGESVDMKPIQDRLDSATPDLPRPFFITVKGIR